MYIGANDDRIKADKIDLSSDKLRFERHDWWWIAVKLVVRDSDRKIERTFRELEPSDCMRVNISNLPSSPIERRSSYGEDSLFIRFSEGGTHRTPGCAL